LRNSGTDSRRGKETGIGRGESGKEEREKKRRKKRKGEKGRERKRGGKKKNG